MANSSTPRAASSFPWKWYGAFAVIGLIVGWLVGGVMASASYNDFSCYSVDGFGNVFFVCEDPTSMFIGVGVIAALAAAYFIRRAVQRS